MPKIFNTVGVYPNGDYKTNGVAADDLYVHIGYNAMHRPGRALFIDGVCYLEGIGVDMTMAQELVEGLGVHHTKCTAPYH
ncbi:MAG: hypothetical protein COA78_28435 [Blastopirellula sp.]|nr:MAG: hypothetical protein COA78_28435 [Blastopirellula sp.]